MSIDTIMSASAGGLAVAVLELDDDTFVFMRKVHVLSLGLGPPGAVEE